MKINTDDINYIAKLAKLKFTEEEAILLAREFEAILHHIESINKDDITSINMYDFKETQGILRKDEVKLFPNKKKLYQNVKESQSNYISIPKVIEG